MARILVVDDEESLAFLIRRVLELEGYEVLTASNGKEALELLRREHVDLVITDYMMPEMDGLEMINRIRKDDSLANLRIIMLTVSDFQDTIDRAFDMGVVDYITKPFDFREIVLAVKSALD